MKTLRKYVSILLALALILAAFSGCTQKGNEAAANNTSNGAENTNTVTKEPVTVRIGSLTGPTTIGLVKLLSDAEDGKTENKYVSTIAGSADELTPLMIKGELDALVGPSNLAAVLYSKTEGKVQMAAITTLGVLSIMTTDESIKTWADLKGRVIYATGKGSTPEYNLRYLLTKNGLDPDKDVTIEFKSEPAEVLALYEASENKSGVTAMFPQPYATVASTKYPEFRRAFDLASEWEKIGEGKMVTACLMVRKDFADANPDAVATLLKEYEASANWVNANVDQAAELTEKYINIKAAVAKKAIPLCSVVCISGSAMKASASAYLSVLHSFKPAAVGGSLPKDDFYFNTK